MNFILMGRTQKTIADTISKELDLPQKVGRLFLQKVIDLIGGDIVYTSHIEIRGLGTFSVTVRPPQNIVHPTTGQSISVPQKKILRFRASINLRRRLNPKKNIAKKSHKR